MTKPWQITGGVVVEEDAMTRDERGRSVVQRRPLAGIPVQISARDNEDEPFEVWGITWTDHDGRFCFRTERRAVGRLVCVSAALIGERLVVGQDMPVRWLDVLELGIIGGPFVDVGAITFAPGALGVLGEPDNVRRALTWYVARSAMSYLVELGPSFAFTQPIAVRYPVQAATETSYAYLEAHTAMIHRDDRRDDWSIDRVLQLVIQLWSNQCVGGRHFWPDANGALRDASALNEVQFAELVAAEMRA
ncbi:MAG TPA: hypothetical protein VIP11_12285, partial [Gemmatimonadaceae bacterium]